MEQVIDHAWIAAHIPHQGSMCLLERVARWDDAGLTCVAASHRDPANPLRAHGRLGAAAGIEYAAQAMAVHGALLASRDADAAAAPKAGFLASVRGTRLHVARLDEVPGTLQVSAQRIHSEGNTILYQFDVASEAGITLLDGRATVIVDAALAAPRQPRY